VKTRLLPRLSADDAAGLQEALLTDTADLLVRVQPDAGCELRLWCAVAEPADEPPLRRLLPRGFGFVAQGQGDLGRRLERVFETLLDTHAATLAIGGDCPDLSPALVRESLAAVARTGAALGPAADGGYWAIGLTEPEPALFRGIAWSTPHVAHMTLERMHEQGCAVELLPQLRDLDRFEDVLAWARAPNRRFRRTLAWCRAQGFA
jgi:rSAM/selenodomain-associated transferase 1